MGIKWVLMQSDQAAFDRGKHCFKTALSPLSGTRAHVAVECLKCVSEPHKISELV